MSVEPLTVPVDSPRTKTASTTWHSPVDASKTTQNVLLSQTTASRMPSISQCNLSCLPQGRSVSATTPRMSSVYPSHGRPTRCLLPPIPASPTAPQITQIDDAALKSPNTPSLEDSSPPSDRQTGRPPPCSTRRHPRSSASRCRSKSPRHRRCRSRCPP
jgi:hypothetical protein